MLFATEHNTLLKINYKDLIPSAANKKLCHHVTEAACSRELRLFS
jgi:hypothetical protein